MFNSARMWAYRGVSVPLNVFDFTVSWHRDGPEAFLEQFQQLYDLEERAKTLSADERLALRQAEALPIWTSLGEWLDGDAAARVLPKGKFGQALGYLRNHWEPLQLYLSDGLIWSFAVFPASDGFRPKIADWVIRKKQTFDWGPIVLTSDREFTIAKAIHEWHQEGSSTT